MNFNTSVIENENLPTNDRLLSTHAPTIYSLDSRSIVRIIIVFTSKKKKEKKIAELHPNGYLPKMENMKKTRKKIGY